jgi:hypothetical protein
MTKLAFVKGPDVAQWVDDYLTTLDTQEQQHGENAEILFTNFEAAFKTAFEYSNQKDDAITSLENLKMVKSDLTAYNNKFNNLYRLAGWDADAEGTMRYYRRGLQFGLLHSMLHDTATSPTTLTAWQQKATKHHDTWKQLANELDMRKTKKKGRPGWAEHYETKKKPDFWRDPDAMDVDAVRVRRPENEEKAKLRREGRCFLCRKQGHLARNCPDPKQKQAEGTKPAVKARASRQTEDDEKTQVDEEEEGTPMMQLRALRSRLGEKQFNGAMDALVEAEDF